MPVNGRALGFARMPPRADMPELEPLRRGIAFTSERSVTPGCGALSARSTAAASRALNGRRGGRAAV